MWQSAISDAVDQQFERMVALRRKLHQHPEVSGEEFETSLLLYQELGDGGFQVRLGPEGRGVIADLDPPENGKTQGIFAVRADIDALRIQDEKLVPYRSQSVGKMHACGHDAHAAMALGAISAIAELYQQGLLPFRPRLRGIFQPAEETCEGAHAMIQAGALDGVAAIVAQHVDPARKLGQIGLRDGVMTANCDHMTITIHGRGGHAARPHEARDPISAAALLVQTFYVQIPRLTDSQDAVVVTFGMLQGGHTANVIPERVELQGTLRTLDGKVRERTIEHINRLARGVSESTRTEIEVHFGLAAGAVVNDPLLNELIAAAADDTLGMHAHQQIARPSMGSEDFSFYCQHVPAAMYRLGCVSDTKGGAGLHTPLFDLDEASLRYGAAIMAKTALQWMQKDLDDSTSSATQGDNALPPS